MAKAAVETGNKDPREPESGSGNIGAAIARSLSRGLAVYFARPIRLFRPSKLSSGWTSLRGLALRDGTTLSPRYMANLVRTEGFFVLPRHFLPPLIVNTMLGTVLWTSYSYTSHELQTHLAGSHPILISAASGAIAGGAQALVAAPAENVRLVLEGADGAGPVRTLLHGKHSHATAGWADAWKEVFRGSNPLVRPSSREDVKEFRSWLNEVRGMSSRGWDGWGWGFGKDIIGFGLFFAIFELSRTAATEMALFSAKLSQRVGPVGTMSTASAHKRSVHTARLVQGCTLVAGGVVAGLGYEMVCRPFDATRRLVYLESVKVRALNARKRNIPKLVLDQIKTEGMTWFFRPLATANLNDSPGAHRHLWAALRTLARVGPWGIGFLIFEGMGGGLTPVSYGL